ncbi:MAG: protein BatD, partial [SAR324 cluster bacterium]|nr:protein BatD [SAR324 cluster bacterium]
MKHHILKPFQFIMSLLFRLYFYSLVVPIVINNVALADITLSATLKDAQIELGESTQLSVTVNGATDASRPILPSVEGLQFISRGQNTQMQYINGKFSSTITFIYMLTPEKAGNYTIPPIQLESGGKIIESEALRLEVKDLSNSGLGNSNSGSQALGTLGQTTPFPDPERENSSAFLRIIIPKTTLYVGESVPVEIRAYFAEALRVSLNGTPTLTGGFFTLQDSKEEPRETHEVFSARSYTVLSWNSLLSAVKEGKLPLIAQLKATMLLRERPRLPNNSMFNNPFFDNDLFNFNEDILDNFFGSVREKSVNLKSPEQNLSVEALPQDGRPEIFDGAVGDFSMKIYSNTRNVEVGDPLTLNVKIAGVGNFDRVVKYSLTKYERWKIYSPAVKFKPLDNRGFHGEKVFEQVLIPQDPEIKELPVPIFAFFDPNKKEYKLLQGDPIPITVSETTASKQRSLVPQGAIEENSADTPIPKKHETSLA